MPLSNGISVWSRSNSASLMSSDRQVDHDRNQWAPSLSDARLQNRDQFALAIGREIAEVAPDAPRRQAGEGPAMARQIARQQLPGDGCVAERCYESGRDARGRAREHD